MRLPRRCRNGRSGARRHGPTGRQACRASPTTTPASKSALRSQVNRRAQILARAGVRARPVVVGELAEHAGELRAEVASRRPRAAVRPSSTASRTPGTRSPRTAHPTPRPRRSSSPSPPPPRSTWSARPGPAGRRAPRRAGSRAGHGVVQAQLGDQPLQADPLGAVADDVDAQPGHRADDGPRVVPAAGPRACAAPAAMTTAIVGSGSRGSPQSRASSIVPLGTMWIGTREAEPPAQLGAGRRATPPRSPGPVYPARHGALQEAAHRCDRRGEAVANWSWCTWCTTCTTGSSGRANSGEKNGMPFWQSTTASKRPRDAAARGGAGVEREVAARAEHPDTVDRLARGLARRPRGEPRDVDARRGPAPGDLVGVLLGAARLRVTDVAPVEQQHARRRELAQHRARAGPQHGIASAPLELQ